ncbi:hypothetical protein FVEN_g12771 [Fusarium venenatum]|nr:hypothetical protein FVEN_g12771 [Fusarium venenatum]
MIAVPSNQAIEDHTDQLLNVQLAATALYLAADLRQHELGVEWDGSIRDWVRMLVEKLNIISMASESHTVLLVDSFYLALLPTLHYARLSRLTSRTGLWE